MTYLPNELSVNLYALCMLLFIYITSRRHGDALSAQRRIYRHLVAGALVLLLANVGTDVLAGMPEMYRAAWFLAYLLYAPLLWLAFLYFRCNIFSAEQHWAVWERGIGGICLLDGLFTLLSPLTGWYYAISDAGVCVRGPWFDVHLLLLVGGLSLLGFMVICFRRSLDTSRFYSLLFFLLPPLLCSLLLLFFDANFVAGGIAFSLMVIFITLQSRDLVTDYLTGAYNRRQLEWILQEKIRTAAQQGFAAIMVDIDSFKQINDAYGHDAGDDALRNTADILRRSVRLKDIVARYGGDEFCVIVSGSLNAAELVGIVSRIEAELRYFNTCAVKPYQLSFSMGYSIYDPASGMDAQHFQKHIDSLMYAQKKTRHAERRRAEDWEVTD